MSKIYANLLHFEPLSKSEPMDLEPMNLPSTLFLCLDNSKSYRILYSLTFSCNFCFEGNASILEDWSYVFTKVLCFQQSAKFTNVKASKRNIGKQNVHEEQWVDHLFSTKDSPSEGRKTLFTMWQEVLIGTFQPRTKNGHGNIELLNNALINSITEPPIIMLTISKLLTYSTIK